MSHRERIQQICSNLRTNCNNIRFLRRIQEKNRPRQFSDMGHLKRNVTYCSENYSYEIKLIITPLVMWNPNRRRAKIHFGVMTDSWNKSF